MTAQNAVSFLKTLGRTAPPWLTYALVGTRQLAYPVFAGPPSALEELQKHILTYYPNAAFSWHDTATELTATKVRHCSCIPPILL